MHYRSEIRTVHTCIEWNILYSGKEMYRGIGVNQSLLQFRFFIL